MSIILKSLNERLSIARELRAKGYGCSQCVMRAFPDIHNLTENQAAALSIGHGGGIGGQGLTCGCVMAMSTLSGFMSGENITDKPTTYKKVRIMTQEFIDRNDTVLCRELKTIGKRPCIELIEDTVRIIHNNLESAG